MICLCYQTPHTKLKLKREFSDENIVITEASVENNPLSKKILRKGFGLWALICQFSVDG